VHTLVFEFGSTSEAPFLFERFETLRFIITNRILNGSPVWAAVVSIDDSACIYNSSNSHMMISDEEYNCVEGGSTGIIFNTDRCLTEHVVAPIELPSNEWVSSYSAMLDSQYATIERIIPGSQWTLIPDMRITALHGLDDSDPTIARALRQLTVFAKQRRVSRQGRVTLMPSCA